MTKLFKIICLSLFGFYISSCVSMSVGGKKEPPSIEDNISMDDALEAALEFGDEVLLKVKKHIKRNKLHKEYEEEIEKRLLSFRSLSTKEVIYLVNLYQFCFPQKPYEIAKKLIQDDDPSLKQLGWHLGAAFPSEKMMRILDHFLSECLLNNELQDQFSPKMADALANNKMRESYTIVREALFQQHHVSYAKAMIKLNPRRSSEDFLNYLSIVPGEELRQLNLTSVDIFVCIEILEFYKNSEELPINSAKFGQLFYFAVSRNNALAEMAQNVIMQSIPKNPSQLAYLLSQTPTWTQVAYLENTRDSLTPFVKNFVSEFKKISVQKEVIDEIDDILSTSTK